MLELQTLRHEEATVVLVAGEIDRDVAPQFRTALVEAARSHPSLLIVDMGGVAFLDSAGLAVLVGVHRLLDVDQQLALAHVPTRLRRVLHDTGMSSMMTIHAVDEPWPWPRVPSPSSPPAAT